MSSRRSFLTTLAGTTAGLTVLPPAHTGLPADLLPPRSQAGPWNMSWVDRLSGRHKACFDCTEVESGYGVWRASAWAGQYMEVLRATPAELSPVVILRHNAIVLAMQQGFWDRYGLGKDGKITHPLTGAAITKNPALLDDKDGIPAPFNQAGLHRQLARGVVALACNLALRDLVDVVMKADAVDEGEATKRAVAGLVTGVILQPSGVFAAVRAQQAGCAYVKAS
jgi:hypothetical protein